MDTWLHSLLALLDLPGYSLVTVFMVATLSATLLPLGSEPLVLGLAQRNPELFWPLMLAATAGNTLGGAINWWIGHGAHRLANKYRHKDGPTHGPPPPPEPAPSATQARARRWLQKLGPKACLLAWLPLVGDPLCLVAGWLRLPFWPCLAYMAVGKFLRYVVMTLAGLGVWNALVGG